MAIETTPRLGLTLWSSGTDEFNRQDMTDSHQNLENNAAGYVLGSQPTPSSAYQGFIHWDGTSLKFCDGSTWNALVATGSSVEDLTASAGDVGDNAAFARADHRHGIANSAITTSMLQDSAVTTSKILNNNVTFTKLVGSTSGYSVLGKFDGGSGNFNEITAGANTVLRRTANGNLAFGTLSTAHIADGQITTDKIGGQQVTLAKMADNSVGSAQYIDGSIQAVHFAPNAVSGASVDDDSIDSQHYVDGSIDTIHIGDNQVTVGKMQLVGANSILARAATGTGPLAELPAGNDSVLRRDGGGNLAFGQIDGAHIGNDTIDSQHYAAGSIDREHLAADVIDSTKLADNAVNSEHYVDGSIDRVHLAADIIDSTKIANDVINSEHYVAGSIDAEHLSGLLYSSGTWQGSLSGNAATATNADKVDGLHASQFLRSDASDSTSGTVTISATTALNLTGSNPQINFDTSSYMKYYDSDSSLQVFLDGTEFWRFDNSGNISKTALYPSPTATQILGGSSNRWLTIYSVNNLDVSSDATMKNVSNTEAPGMEFIRLLRSTEWEWADKSWGEGTQWGPTAQNIRDALTQIGRESSMVSGEEGNLSVRFNDLFGSIINALKELDSRLAAVEV